VYDGAGARVSSSTRNASSLLVASMIRANTTPGTRLMGQISCWAASAAPVVIESSRVVASCRRSLVRAMLAGSIAVDVDALWCGRARKLA
jgi:hypothetical protein